MKTALLILLTLLAIYALIATLRLSYYLNQSRALAQRSNNQNYTMRQGDEVRTVAVLGDSTAAGTGTSYYTKTYHYQFLSQLPGNYTFEVSNFGQIGARVRDLKKQVSSISSYDLIIVSITGNDIVKNTNQDQLRSDLEAVLPEILQKANNVILVTPGDFGTVRNVPIFLRWWWHSKNIWLSKMVTHVTKKYDIIFVDIFRQEDDRFNKEPKKYYASDLFHPSDLGYQTWAEIIFRVVNQSEFSL